MLIFLDAFRYFKYYSYRKFDICKSSIYQLAEGKYDVQISLAKSLDYERRNSYLINLLAIDGASDVSRRLQARATVAVDVLDVQVSRPRL